MYSLVITLISLLPVAYYHTKMEVEKLKCPKFGVEIDQVCHVFCDDGKACLKKFVEIPEEQLRSIRLEVIVCMLTEDEKLRKQLEVYLQ